MSGDINAFVNGDGEFLSSDCFMGTIYFAYGLKSSLEIGKNKQTNKQTTKSLSVRFHITQPHPQLPPPLSANFPGSEKCCTGHRSWVGGGTLLLGDAAAAAQLTATRELRQRLRRPPVKAASLRYRHYRKN
ncbi:Prefoldin Subunit 3 [Manis pentadactyla]|nr:Prefoldin Subunit 3 [Manis pentadactyla]